MAVLFFGCGGGGGGSSSSSTPTTTTSTNTTTTTTTSTGTISGVIALPSNANAKLFEFPARWYAELFISTAHAAAITDLTKLTVTAGSTTTSPDSNGSYTLSVTPGTNVEVTITAPSGNVVLTAIVPSVTAGVVTTQVIDSTSTAIALIYKQNTSLTISQIEASSAVTNVKNAVETALTDATTDSIASNSTVTSAAQTAATSMANENNNAADTAKQISTGEWHTCAVTSSGGVKCWGYNDFGQLGNGTTTSSTAPVDVSGLQNGVSFASSGRLHTCALTTSGGVKCWGDNTYGQLGMGTDSGTETCGVASPCSRKPVDVFGLSSDVISISAGRNHTCAITSSYGMKCWGNNSYGQLGDGMQGWYSSVPVTVSGLSGMLNGSANASWMSAGGNHTCARAISVTDASDKCWGYNEFGQLGDGTTTNRKTPVKVSIVSSPQTLDISAGKEHTCRTFLTNQGILVECWGNNSSGQLGNGTTTNNLTPVQVSFLNDAQFYVSAGSEHTCALTASGGVKCWGRNAYGQLGNGKTTNSTIPVSVSGLSSGASAVSAGGKHTCALTSSNTVKCWGMNNNGQLGNGTTVDSTVPVSVSNSLYTHSLLKK